MNPVLRNILIGVLVVILAFLLGRSTAPVKIEEKVKVEKAIDTITVVKEIKRPDGTIEKETTQVDKSKITSQKSTTVESAKAMNKVALGMGYDFKDKSQVYNLSYERRLVGNIWVGAFGVSNGTVGLTVGLEF